MDILAELRKAYKQEWWQKLNLSKQDTDRYYGELLTKDKLICLYEDEFIGYIEFWFVTEQQVEEILKNETWSPMDNDILSGDVAYVQAIWINPKYRGDKKVDCKLKKMFFDKIKGKSVVWQRAKMGKKDKLIRRNYG